MRTQSMVIAFYLLDTLLMVAFAAQGVVSFAAPLAFGLTGCGVSALFALAIHLRLHRRMTGENFTTLQLLFACGLIVATAAAVPQIGLLLLMTLIVAVATAALQLPLRRVLAVAAMVVAASVTLLLVHGERVGAPLADVAQRMLSGLWFSVILIKIAAINLIGTQMRNALSSSNARLAVALDKVRELSERDELTGLRNRRSILALLAEERARFARGGPAFGVAILDIDHFKQVNDRLGHSAGDTVLRAFAQTVAGKLRGTDQLARYGGEEFLLVLPVIGESVSAEAAAQRLRRAVNEHAWSDLVPDLKITCSIGVTLSQSGEDVATMLERADVALYQAKASGRDAVWLA
jgi:diguanylate cyclase